MNSYIDSQPLAHDATSEASDQTRPVGWEMLLSVDATLTGQVARALTKIYQMIEIFSDPLN